MTSSLISAAEPSYPWGARMGTPPGAVTRGRGYGLFDGDAVGLAVFICCRLAGTTLMVNQLREAGKDRQRCCRRHLGLIATMLPTPQSPL